MSDLAHSLEKLKSTYPRDVSLSDGSEANLRLAGWEDNDAILRFARGLPEDDLLFLRVDITEPSVVDNWLSNIEQGTTLSIIAYDGIPEGRWVRPQLTTFSVDSREAGERLSALLMARVRGVEPETLRETRDAKLLTGGSDGPPRLASAELAQRVAGISA